MTTEDLFNKETLSSLTGDHGKLRYQLVKDTDIEDIIMNMYQEKAPDIKESRDKRISYCQNVLKSEATREENTVKDLVQLRFSTTCWLNRFK